MSVIYLLISISIIVAIVFFFAFIKAVKSGQFDDDYTPSVRMLFDDELKPSEQTTQARGELSTAKTNKEKQI